MIPFCLQDPPGPLPDGTVAVRLSPDGNASPLNLCVLARRRPDPVAGHLWVIRELTDAKVYLGCIADAGRQVHQWVEVWVQHHADLAMAPLAARGALSNAQLDSAWRKRYAAMRDLDPATVIETGWEQTHPPPTYLDLAACRTVVLSEGGAGGFWRLCTDDALLGKNGLPAYGPSLHRYIYLEGVTPPVFVPVTPGAPEGPATAPLTRLTSRMVDSAPFNPEGGLMMVRKYDVLSFAEFSGILSAAVDGKQLESCDPPAPTAGLFGGEMFLAGDERPRRVLEILYLKLRMLDEAVAQVRRLVKRSQSPVLHLSDESFRVGLTTRARGLPLFWTVEVSLINPAVSLALPAGRSDTPHFLPAELETTSPYHFAGGQASRGRGIVTLTSVPADMSGPVVIEGTLTPDRRLEESEDGLVWMRLSAGDKGVSLYGLLDTRGAADKAPIPFKSSTSKLPSTIAGWLSAAVGTPRKDTLYEFVPRVGTPHDLYAMGVLAVRTLLGNDSAALPGTVDAINRLARAADEGGAASPLRQRIQAVFDSDETWMDELGSHHVVAGVPAAGSGSETDDEVVLRGLWYDTLAMIVRTVPGIGPDSTCASPGDWAPGRMEATFDRLCADLRALLLRVRSLILVDWRLNREVDSVIEDCIGDLEEAGQASEPLSS